MQLERWPLYALVAVTLLLVYLALMLGANVTGIYRLILLPAFALAIWAYDLYKRYRYTDKLQALRASWGHEQLKKDRNLQESSLLFENMNKEDGFLDDRTWHDLNLGLVFEKLDRTLTNPGEQRLYQILRTPVITNKATLIERNAMIHAFQNDSYLREEIQMSLNMDTRIGSELSTLLWDQPVFRHVHHPVLYKIMFFLGALSPLLIILNPMFAFLVILIFQANMYLHFSVQKQTKAYFEGIRSLGQLINTSKNLMSAEAPELESLLEKIKSATPRVQHFSKIVRNVGVESSEPLTAVAIQYYSILFLAEVRGFYRALKFIEENRTDLQTLFLTVGELDALQSIASYRCSLPYYCEPKYTNRREIQLEEVYHPLLKEPVSNSISTNSKGILVTGSNMSGKSTFLRTVGLNIVFAQTITTCLAKKCSLPPTHLMTSIGRADNLVEGKSYYLEEALGVLRIVEAVNDDVVTFAIFDELFRGTNSEERIFAAKQVLKYLWKRNTIVFVATHDLELVELLAGLYDSVHFSEEVSDFGLHFDYKLKKGPATTKNAIALLRYLQYPLEVTDPLT